MSKFAQIADTTVRTLRHYRQLGILVPTEKNEQGQMVYTTEEFKAFHSIRLLQSLGLSLKEIKERSEKPGYSFEKMIDVQEQVLIRKREAIDYSLQMINRVKSIKGGEKEELDEEVLMLLMNSMLYEEAQRDIMKDYYDKEVVDRIFPKDMRKQKEIDRQTLQVLTIANRAVMNGDAPEDARVQGQLREWMDASYVKEWEVDEAKLEELTARLEPYTSILPAHLVTFLSESFAILAEETETESLHVEKTTKKIDK
ncbi:MerR family transcriptional regulator [Paenalkalicoccus suaedae]|uniref:MerR family transcriptional regulator n=1 Tax=Paenalkalicoccus suaedae TaxID=2592382 RepID=A0A859FIY8_9BACI|nr:MerR family transcriptional regulator [Paenalkalicoccus suaedae]